MSSGIPADAREVYRRYVSAVVLHGQASAAALGLNATDLYALNVLHLAGSLSSGALASRTGLTTGATTRLIDRLERAGHIRRVPDPTDRRRMFIEPAGQGLEIDDVVGPARRRVGEVMRRFDPEQLATLFEYFRLAADAYQDAIAEMQAADDPPVASQSPT